MESLDTNGSVAKSCGGDIGLLQPQILQAMARNQAIKYARWTAKYDKSRDEDEEEEDKTEVKRKRASPEQLEQSLATGITSNSTSLGGRQPSVFQAATIFRCF